MSRLRLRLLVLLSPLLSLGCRTPPAELPEVEVGAKPDAEPGRIAKVFVEQQPAEREEPPGSFAPISAEIAALYRCWFRNPYSYMFSHEGEPLEVDGQRYGMLMAGISGILYYGDLNTCAGELTGLAPRSYSDIAPIEALAGVPATLDAPQLEFATVNPELIAYARQNLLPSPEQVIDGVPVQLAYDRVFQRFFRMMGLSLMLVLESSEIDVETDDYLAATSAGANGIDWLETRYAGWLPQLGGYADGTTMTAGMAAGFWLRRHADGSFAACWHGLRDVFERFDPVWLAEQEARHAHAAAVLAQLPDPLQ